MFRDAQASRPPHRPRDPPPPFAVPALAATKSVKVGDNYFVRASGVPTVTIKKNDTVKWNFAGEKPHNVKVKSGPMKFTLQDDGPAARYSKKFTEDRPVHDRTARSTASPTSR